MKPVFAVNVLLVESSLRQLGCASVVVSEHSLYDVRGRLCLMLIRVCARVSLSLVSIPVCCDVDSSFIVDVPP